MSNGIGKQWDEFETTANELNKTSTGDELSKSQEQKAVNLQTKLNNLKTSNPKLWTAASNMYTSVNETTGEPYTEDEILQAFPESNN